MATKTETPAWKKELCWVLLLLLIGLTAFPLAIYYLGNAFAGGYGGGNALSFLASLTRDVAAGSILAWLVVLAPLLWGQVLRLAWVLLRRQTSVRTVTVPEES